MPDIPDQNIFKRYQQSTSSTLCTLSMPQCVHAEECQSLLTKIFLSKPRSLSCTYSKKRKSVLGSWRGHVGMRLKRAQQLLPRRARPNACLDKTNPFATRMPRVTHVNTMEPCESSEVIHVHARV